MKVRYYNKAYPGFNDIVIKDNDIPFGDNNDDNALYVVSVQVADGTLDFDYSYCLNHEFLSQVPHYLEPLPNDTSPVIMSNNFTNTTRRLLMEAEYGISSDISDEESNSFNTLSDAEEYSVLTRMLSSHNLTDEERRLNNDIDFNNTFNGIDIDYH